MGFLTLIFGPKVLAHKNIGSKATPTRKWQKRFSQLYKFWTSYLSISIISCLKLFYVIRQFTLKTLDFFLKVWDSFNHWLEALRWYKNNQRDQKDLATFRNVKNFLTCNIRSPKSKVAHLIRNPNSYF